MTQPRLPAADPRTIARDIPGVLDALFPQLNAGVVAFYNRTATRSADAQKVPQEKIDASPLQRAMLFELAFAASEQLVTSEQPIDWMAALNVAVNRQRRHFDAKIPDNLHPADIAAALEVANNLATILRKIGRDAEAPIVVSPSVPGYEWIASSAGDFAVGDRLIEIKCSSRHFGAADYRQLMMYWLLSFADSLRAGTPEWRRGVLINPRLNLIVDVKFDELLYVISSGRTKLEMVQIFSSMIGTRHNG